jgi:hypothetical protein
MLWHLVMPEVFVNYVQNGASDGREAGDMSGQLKCASCEPRNYKYFRSANNAPRQSYANGFRHVRLRSSSSQRLCEMPHGSIYPSGLRPFVVPQNYGATKNVNSEGDPCKGKP